jgi:dephospho-CoA kinase
MKILGLTGGISCGKSTVSHFISTSKVEVVDADKVAREVVLPGSPAYHLILDHFGTDILLESSEIDRNALGKIIFSNAEERAALNNLTHPRIKLLILKQVVEAFLLLNSMVVIDTPLLFEAGFYRWVHVTVVVYCPPSMQLDRLMTRDKIGPAEAKAKMDSQMSIEQKKNLAQHVIDNSGSMTSSRDQTEKLLQALTPSFYVTVLMWMFLFWPAVGLYVILFLYIKLDQIRHVGLFTSRPIPEVVRRHDPLAYSAARAS